MRPFELNDELADQIRFAMENQDQVFLFDCADHHLVPAADCVEDPERFLPLPGWNSMDGFTLMESFTAGLRNPLLRTELHRILQGGKGVFRAFKDTLRTRPEIERLWHRYKDREMRRRVWDWYNELRDYWGLERMAVEQDTESLELVDADFSFHALDPARSAQVIELDRAAFDEMYPDWPERERPWLHLHSRNPSWDPADHQGGNYSLSIETAAGDFAGFCWARLDAPGPDTRLATIIQLYVLPEFRGLGLGKALYEKCRAELAQGGCTRLALEVPSGAAWLVDYLGQGHGRPRLWIMEEELGEA